MKNLVGVILIFGTCICLESFCQERYVSGYIVLPPGDTIQGFIDYHESLRNPKEISFKNESTHEPKLYTPIDIVGFGVKDEIYERAIIQIEVNQNSANKLLFESELTLKRDTVFLLALIQGNKSLYIYTTNQNKEQFYIKQDAKYELLIYQKYLKERSAVSGLAATSGSTEDVVVENKRYQGQLAVYLQDCATIQSKLKKTSYTQQSLSKLFEFYYTETNQKSHHVREIEKMSLKVGIVSGLTLTTVKFSGESNTFVPLKSANFNTSANLSAAIFFDAVLPGGHLKWSLYNELAYSSYTIDGSYMDYVNEDSFKEYTFSIGASYIKMNNLIRVKYPFQKSFLYVQAGFSNGLSFNETNSKITESTLFNTVTVTEEKAMEETRNLESGLILGAGYTFKKYAIEFRHENSNGLSTYSTLKSATIRNSILFSYRF